jgi:enterochelin esterase-like enzyme
MKVPYGEPTTPPAANETIQTSVSIQTPEPIPTSTPKIDDCRTRPGDVVRIIFRSDVLNDPYTVSIYTPPCYDETAEVKYPVLYLLHGQNMDDSFWLSLGAAEIVDEMISNGSAPFLMVMPFEEKNFDPPTESKFGESIINELIPWVEDHYSVCTERDCRAIGGISRGGGWAMRLAMRNFDTFGAVGGHSLGPMAGDWWQAQKHLETHTPDEYPCIYIDRGEDDFLATDIDSFEKVLASNGIPHEYYINPGKHTVEYWQAHVAEYLQWYAEGWE